MVNVFTPTYLYKQPTHINTIADYPVTMGNYLGNIMQNLPEPCAKCAHEVVDFRYIECGRCNAKFHVDCVNKIEDPCCACHAEGTLLVEGLDT